TGAMEHGRQSSVGGEERKGLGDRGPERLQQPHIELAGSESFGRRVAVRIRSTLQPIEYRTVVPSDVTGIGPEATGVNYLGARPEIDHGAHPESSEHFGVSRG